ncbi:alkaline phosphatase D family protein [Motilimonas cestriensis]|uniref:Alkaline phosphatase D family protein n=1 Tax=Motilimonas cestriensis TaxID=2742685 RepID=A0ABS8W7X4_9GAMM|nr:alkaline phosphatase D family protein [Motilimonas cestriensis]
MSKPFSRRDFIRMSAMGAGAAVLSIGLMGCNDSSSGPANKKGATTNEPLIGVGFQHGIASGDPLSDRVIIWTKVTPKTTVDKLTVSWEVAEDEGFTKLVTNGETETTADRDFTVKVDAGGLSANATYYYRFHSNGVSSAIGRMRTLPEGSVAMVKLAAISCSNYPAGYFNVLAEIAKQDDLNAVLHLGDYIYEYADGGYASEEAKAMGRVVEPIHELLTLADYRMRYAQYRLDADMQLFHSRLPIIPVWDDHEIANDTWREGAENHQSEEGEFEQRKMAAIQAYFEWLPIRPLVEGNNETIYRSFKFGDLVDLHMLDTRLIGRDQQLDYANYLGADGSFNASAFMADVGDPNRTMMGAEQFEWLKGQLTTSVATWQVLGQQTLMGNMSLPASLITQQISLNDFSELAYIAQLAQQAQVDPSSLTAAQLLFLEANQQRLTADAMQLLQSPKIPYNLDAWDGYAYEREVLLATAKQNNANLVVLSGDTHNAWANDLRLRSGGHVGVEFAVASVSSPGMEVYLGVKPENEPGMVQLVDDLKYTNLTNRGYMMITFTPDTAVSEWLYCSTVKSKQYEMLTDRQHRLMVKVNTNTLISA